MSPDDLLSPHFSWRELTHTDKREYLSRNRKAAEVYRDRIKSLCVCLLEPIRSDTGPIQILSGFRSKTLNSSLHGSSGVSQHMMGEAVDCIGLGKWTFPEVAEFYEMVVESCRNRMLPFGQIILEKRQRKRDRLWGYWLHLSAGYPWRAVGKCGLVMESTWPIGQRRPSYEVVERIKPPMRGGAI